MRRQLLFRRVILNFSAKSFADFRRLPIVGHAMWGHNSLSLDDIFIAVLPKCGSFESSFWQHSHHSLQCSYWTDPSKNSASPVVYFLNWFIKSIRWFETDRPTLNCESGLHLVLTKQTKFIHERIFQNRSRTLSEDEKYLKATQAHTP